MGNNIEKEMIDRRESRDRSSGEGAQLLEEIDNKDSLIADDEGKKYYRRKGLGNIEQFDYAGMYKRGYDPVVREDGSAPVPNVFMKPKERLIFGYDITNGQKVDTMPHEATLKGSPLRIIVGGALDAVQGTVQFARDIQKSTGMYLPETMETLGDMAASYQPEWLQESAGWGEDIARDVAQFAGGYAGAIKSLGKMGMRSSVAKDIAASTVAGQTFDPEEGNLGTFLNDFGLLPEMMQFMDSRLTTEQEGRMTGRLALAIEETGLGLGVYSARSAMAAIKSRYQLYGNELMKQGSIKYGEATSVVSGPHSLGVDEVVDEENATKALNMMASGFQITGGNNESFMAMAKQSGIEDSLAQKAWNNAAKEKLNHIASFVSPSGPTTPMARQSGAVNMGTGDVIRDNQGYAVDDLERHFKKQMSRGGVQPSEYNETIKPAIAQLKAGGVKSVTGKQLKQMASANKPTFKTIEVRNPRFYHETSDPTQSLDVRESERVGKRTANAALPSNLAHDMKYSYQVQDSYKEHLFVTRNPASEEPNGFLNIGHYSEPFVKGIVRTTRTAPNSLATKSTPKSVVIQEMQSDQANAARKYGEWTNKQILDAVPNFEAAYQKEVDNLLKPNSGYGGLNDPDLEIDALNDASIAVAREMGKVFKVDMENDANWIYYMMDEFIGNGMDVDEIADNLHIVARSRLATPSVFNQDKAWVRQVMRPVVEEARKNGATRITLSNGAAVEGRWGEGASKLYEGSYPKIMKQYFKDLGVPDKNIHMPKNKTESFYVDLPPELMEQGSNLPLYSAGMAGPLAIDMGNNDGNK